MSLSEALGPYPVIHHFYPIDPETASQQQSAVYNAPDYPLVAPIAPVSSQQAREPLKKKAKKKVIEEEIEVEALIAGSSVGRSTHEKAGIQRALRSRHKDLGFSAVHLAPQKRQRMAWIDISLSKSFDRASYRPISLRSLSFHPPLGRGKRHTHPRVLPSPPPFSEISFSSSATPGLSTASDDSYDPDADSAYLANSGDEKKGPPTRARKAEAKPALVSTPVGEELEEEEATTCHQCRRKTTREKMRCRNLRSDGKVCTFYFCKGCVEIRYGEPFDSFHCAWHCPRCRGICNCSICLRKAGFGYILDGPASEQFTGVQGRLSVSGKRKEKTSRGNVKVGAGRVGADGVQQQVSVREWLARKGIALGTDEWMEERRQQGVRFVIGMSPPPFDGSSPYMEAHLNPSLVACEDLMEDNAPEVNNPGFPLDPRLKGEGDIMPTMASGSPAVEGGGALPSSQATGLDVELWPPVNGEPGISQGVNSLALSSPHGAPFPPSLLSQSPAKDLPPPQTPTEDLPGLSPGSTRGIRLIVGSPFPRLSRKKRSGTLKIKKQTMDKRKKADDSYDSCDGGVARISELNIRLPATRVRRRRFPSAISNWEDDPEDEKEPIAGPSSIPEHAGLSSSREFAEPSSSHENVGPSSGPEYGVTFFYADDPPLTPPAPAPSLTPLVPAPPLPPPSEPVLVPTEYYTPSKLDAPRVKDPQAQFGHSYWSLNAFNSQAHEQEQEHERVTSPSLFTRATLYSYDEPYHDPQLALDDLSPAGASHVGSGSGSASTTLADAHHSRSASTSLSMSHTPNDYLTPHTHAHTQQNGYAASGLPSFAALEDTWIPMSDPGHVPGIDMDMPPLQMESVTRAVRSALSSVGM